MILWVMLIPEGIFYALCWFGVVIIDIARNERYKVRMELYRMGIKL